MRITWLIILASPLLRSGAAFVKSEGWMTIVRDVGLQLSLMSSVGWGSSGISLSHDSFYPTDPPVIVVHKGSGVSNPSQPGVILHCLLEPGIYYACRRVVWSRLPLQTGNLDDENENAVFLDDHEAEEDEKKDEDFDDGVLKNERSPASSGKRRSTKGKAKTGTKMYRIDTDLKRHTSRLYLMGTGEAFRGRYSCTIELSDGSDFHTSECRVTDSLLRKNLNAEGKLCSELTEDEDGDENDAVTWRTLLFTGVALVVSMVIVMAIRCYLRSPHRCHRAAHRARCLERLRRLGSRNDGDDRGSSRGNGQRPRSMLQQMYDHHPRRCSFCARHGITTAFCLDFEARYELHRVQGHRSVSSAATATTSLLSPRGGSSGATSTQQNSSGGVSSSEVVVGSGHLEGLPSYQDSLSPQPRQDGEREGQDDALLVHKNTAAQQNQHHQTVPEASQALLIRDVKSAQPPPPTYEHPSGSVAALSRLASSDRRSVLDDLNLADVYSTSLPPSYRSTRSSTGDRHLLDQSLSEASSHRGSGISDTESPYQGSGDRVETTHPSGTTEPDGSPCAPASPPDQQALGTAEKPDSAADPPDWDALPEVLRWLLGTPPPAYDTVVSESEPV